MTMVYVLLALNALFMIILPVLLGIWISRRYHVGWMLFLLGAVGFVASQILHIPFNQFVLNPIITGLTAGEPTAAQTALAALLLGLSAGVFEEVTRFLFYRFRSSMRDWNQGLMFGAGWGGIEAIILGFFAATTAVNVYIYQSGLIETMMTPDQLANSAEAIAAGARQIEELVSSPLWMFLLGALERVFALILHLSLSILVLQVFLRKNIIWLFAAIGWHTLVNAVAVFGAMQGWHVLLIEGLLAVAAVISIFIIRYFKPGDEAAEPDQVSYQAPT